MAVLLKKGMRLADMPEVEDLASQLCDETEAHVAKHWRAIEHVTEAQLVLIAGGNPVAIQAAMCKKPR